MDISPSQEPLFPEQPSTPPTPPQPAPAEPPPAEPVVVSEPVDKPELRRYIALVLAALAGLLALAGTFLPHFEIRQPFVNGFAYSDDSALVIVESAWGTEIRAIGQETLNQAGAPLGVPLLLAVALLLAAAVAGAQYASGRASGTLAKALTTAGALFLAGVVSTIGMEGMAFSLRDDFSILETTIVLGMWLLMVAAVVGIAAVVMIYLPARHQVPTWADPSVAFADTATPPSGFSLQDPGTAPSGIPVQAEGVAITVLPPEPPPADAWDPDRGERG